MINIEDIPDPEVKRWYLSRQNTSDTVDLDIPEFSTSLWKLNRELVIEEAANEVTEMRGKPLFVDVEFHNNCNLECIHCHIKHSQAEISGNSMSILLSLMPTAEIVEIGKAAEPLLKPKQLMYFLEHTRKLNPIVKVSLLANGTSLSPKTCEGLIHHRLTVLHVSIDSHDDKLFGKFRPGGSLSQIKSNLMELKKIKELSQSPYPFVSINCQMTGFADPFKMVEFAHEVGAAEFVLSRTQHPIPYLAPWTWQEMYDPKDLDYIFQSCQDKCKEYGMRFGHTGIEHIDGDQLAYTTDTWEYIWEGIVSHQFQSPGTDPICHSKAPWMRWCSSLDQVSPCCWHSAIDNMSSVKSYEEIWNGNGYRKLRGFFRDKIWPASCRCRA